MATDHKINKHKIYLLVGIILLLIASNVYLVVKSKHETKRLEHLPDQNQNLNAEILTLEHQIDDYKNSELKLTTQLEDQRKVADSKIKELKQILKIKELTQVQLDFTIAEVQRLKNFVKVFQQEIDVLKKENLQLKTKNDSLSNEAKGNIVKITGLNAENIALNQKVLRGSILKTAAITIKAFQVKAKVKNKETNKAKLTNQILVRFSFAPNELVRKQLYDVYMRVFDPLGNLIALAANTFVSNGESFQYTYKTSVDFLNDASEYDILWTKINGFDQGDYTIILYTEKGVMGQGKINLR